MNHYITIMFCDKLSLIYDYRDRKKCWTREHYEKALNESQKTKIQNQYNLGQKYRSRKNKP